MKRFGDSRVRRHPMVALCLFIPWMAFWLSFAGFANAPWTRLDQYRFPWAYAESGRPTLTGVWAGRLTTDQRNRRGLLLHLELVPLKFPRRGTRSGGFNLRFFHRTASDNLTGELYLCGAAQGEQHFTVRGNVGTGDASRFQLSVSVADSATADGLAPRMLRGTWDGRDSLNVNADLYVRYHGQAVNLPHASETTRPQPGALHRADSAEFRTLCERLWTGP
ncbi:MAG: hypothetical protein DMD35_19530 [Gemmatimonadetes bacterium]|nr:MAG: hypothetical protein DMD35_19530 [Gemmatimonadota bacterium]